MLENFIDFINRSPTVYHAAHEISQLLTQAGFTALSEQDKWDLTPGKSYFVMREASLVAAFRLPKKSPKSTILLASHLDSPGLKIKPKPDIVSHGMGLIGTEPYGGPLLHTWIDRDVAIAGRVMGCNKKGRPESKLVLLDDEPLIIPGLAIHLQREVNEKGLVLHKQDHLKAIYSTQSKKEHLSTLLRKRCSFDQLLSFDLSLVPLEKASRLGADREFISSYRLDNLTSAFASLYALLHTKAHAHAIQMAIFWDHEEIGSKTYAGADSLFGNQVLERICLNAQLNREDYYCLKSRSLCLSCDVGHAVHPNYADKYDPENGLLMGKGPAIKWSSKYATTAATAAPIVHMAAHSKIPLQATANRSDTSGGGTVGAIMGANLGIPTLDIGIGCWAMHSIRETIAGSDQTSLCNLLKTACEEL